MSLEMNKQKKGKKYPNILALGSSLNLELTLSLDEKQYESIGIKFIEISKLEDLHNLFPNQSPLFSLKIQKLTSLIELQSNNFLFNSILFINQSCKRKLHVKYLIPFCPKFPKELCFIYDIIKIITEKNYIYIEEFNLLDIKPNIIFTFKLIDKDIIVEQKSFLITNENQYNNNTIEENKTKENKNEKEYKGKLLERLNISYDYDYFYSTINELFDCKKYSENEIIEFINSLIIKCPDIKICINYDENYLLDNKDFIKNIISKTDIFIFEKKDIIHFYNNLFSQNNDEINENKENKIEKKNIIEEFFIYNIQSERINQKIKIGIFINDMKEIFILQQDPKTSLVIFQLNQNINLVPINLNENDRKKYDELISIKYSSIKSVYIGAFLNRIIREESFDICLKMSLKCSIKYLDILKFGLDVPSIQNYYEIKAVKNHKKKINKLEIKNKQLENKFILDCTNLNNKKNLYNSLYDENCANFLNSKETRRHLQKQGFINKKGMILVDPVKDKFITMSKKEKKDIFTKFQIKFNNIKEIRQNNDKRREKIIQISLVNQKALNHFSFKDFDSINFCNSNTSRQFFLPKIKNKNTNSNKTPNIFKKFEIFKRENNKEDVKKSLNNRKKNLSEMNFCRNKILNPIKPNKKSFLIEDK